MPDCQNIALSAAIFGGCLGASIALIWAKLRVEKPLQALIIHWQERAMRFESKMLEENELAQDLSQEDGTLT